MRTSNVCSMQPQRTLGRECVTVVSEHGKSGQRGLGSLMQSSVALQVSERLD